MKPGLQSRISRLKEEPSRRTITLLQMMLKDEI